MKVERSSYYDIFTSEILDARIMMEKGRLLVDTTSSASGQGKMCEIDDCYYSEIKANLPRVLSLFDVDPTNNTYGLGDRYYWAWGLIDFANATFQGAVHGLARLYVEGLWPFQTSEKAFVGRIHRIICGTKEITRKDGSLEEAFPNEGSYCVTALVAFDTLCAIELLQELVPDSQRREWLEVVRPLIGFLTDSDETHAFISNHLATAAAALFRWHTIFPDQRVNRKAAELLAKIQENQSEEGWYLEYEGFDPGYQSLCTYYLADILTQQNLPTLTESLNKATNFIKNFAHPDGSFGGAYGSRCTRFYVPAGYEFLSSNCENAKGLAAFMRISITKKAVVTLSAVDEPNLIPIFNSYCWAAVLAKKSRTAEPSIKTFPIPCELNNYLKINFSGAGIFIDKGSAHYSIINYKKGGVIYHFCDSKMSILDCGVLIRKGNNKFASTQSANSGILIDANEKKLIIKSYLTEMPKRVPSSVHFVVLRLLSLTIFRSRFMREFVKKNLVKMLITRKKIWPGRNMRSVILGRNMIISDDYSFEGENIQRIEHNYFVPIHMASQGYWQVSDEDS